MKDRWEDVEVALASGAKAITWDGCHKIYIAMDERQAMKFLFYGYVLTPVNDDNVDEALSTLREWYELSCGLRFINSVRTVDGDPNEGFDQLIPQFADELGEEELV